MLSRCPQLEGLGLGAFLNNSRCGFEKVFFREADFLRPLPAGCWPNLQYHDFHSDCDEELQRLRQGGPSPAYAEVICQVDEPIVPQSLEPPITEVDVSGEPELPAQVLPEIQPRLKKRRVRKVSKARQPKESASNARTDAASSAKAAEANVEINFINLTAEMEESAPEVPVQKSRKKKVWVKRKR